jgi:hypothetical protein
MRLTMVRGIHVAEQVVHRDVESLGNPSQRAGAWQSGLSALDLIERRP